jgi:signal transduction histidine kinase
MSRSVPMDELLRQLAESLQKSMGVARAEVWTGTGGHLERQVSVPDAGIGQVVLEGEELVVASRTHVAGNGWLAVWIPALLDGRGDRVLRVAPVAHLGELLGLLVVERTQEDTAFVEEDDRVLADLARQLGLALHNVRLDSALQDSLEQLQLRNEELVASRARIVSAADESRRSIERNLHDGAQQHLVALAVKVGLVRQIMVKDPDAASSMLDELREDVQVTVGELRELAHGIYPPLLRDRGLPEALRTAAHRAALPTRVVVAEDLGRFPTDLEAAVYFCCLEAMQNAGKHAGDGAEVTVTVAHADGELRFSVADDGVGFQVGARPEGHGFVNMEDRLGAMGGRLEVESAPGRGTTVSGTVPVA